MFFFPKSDKENHELREVNRLDSYYPLSICDGVNALMNPAIFMP